MSHAMGLLRGSIVRLATTAPARAAVQRPAVSQEVVRRFIAGETTASALEVSATLLNKGRLICLAWLSPPAYNERDVAERVAGYRQVLAEVAASGLVREHRIDLNLPLSRIGIRLGADGPALALAQARALGQAAANAGVDLTVEPEPGRLSQDSIDLAVNLRQDFPRVAVSLPACWRRTEADCAQLAATGSRVRLSRGFPSADPQSHHSMAAVDRAYVRAMRTLMEGPGYPILATHDPRVLTIADALANHLGRAPTSFEYMMRYGVRTETQIVIADRGDQMRVLLPFGPDWYPYLVRRITAAPANVIDIVRAAAAR